MNLSGAMRTSIANNMKEPTAHIFVDAQKAVYNQMYNNSFHRFIDSDIYRNAAAGL